MKVAACIAAGRSDCQAVAERMARAQCLDPHHRVESFAVGGGALAVVDTTAREIGPRLRHTTPDGSVLLVSGVPLAPRGSVEDALTGLAGGEFHAVLRALSGMDGAHASLYWDARVGQLGIVTDILGAQPLYMVQLDGVLLLATELKAFGASGFVPVEADPAGWGAFLSFGHAIADHTMLRGAQRVAPGAILTYKPSSGALRETSYWSWPAQGPDMSMSEVDTEALVEPMRRDVERYLEYHPHGVLLLSGGFDSRLLLALVLSAGARPSGITLAHSTEARGADGRYAVELARRFGIDLQRFDSPRSFYQSRPYLDYVQRSEVATQSLYLFIAQVAEWVTREAGAIWDGVFPGPAIRPPGTFVDVAKREAQTAGGLWRGADIVLRPGVVRQMRESYAEQLEREWTRYADDGSRAREFFVRNRTRNRTSPNPLTVYANRVLPFTPGVNRDSWRCNVAVPTARDKSDLYLHVLQRHFPEFLRVPVISGGGLVRRGPYDVRYAVDRAASGASSLYARVSASRFGARIRGTPHAHPPGFWTTRGMIDRVIERVPPGHPDLEPDGVRRVQQASAHTGALAAARHLLFYWQMWRWIMAGELTEELKAELTVGTVSA